MATFAKHLDALDSEIDRCRQIAASLLRGVGAELSEVMAAAPAHPMASRVREILATLEQFAGLRAEVANGRSPSAAKKVGLPVDRSDRCTT